MKSGCPLKGFAKSGIHALKKPLYTVLWPYLSHYDNQYLAKSGCPPSEDWQNLGAPSNERQNLGASLKASSPPIMFSEVP